MKRLPRFFGWLIFNGAYYACFYHGLINGVVWSWNLFLFLLWCMTVIGFLVFASEKSRALARERGRTVPAWIPAVLDVTVACILAAHGFFLLAVVQLLQTLIDQGIYREPETAEAQP